MDMITSITTRTAALQDILAECNAALTDRGVGVAPNLSGIAARIKGISNLRVLRGSFTPEADSTSLTLPIPGFPKAVSFCQKDVTRVENQIMCAVYDPFNWKAIAGESKGVILYRTPKTTVGSMTMPSYTALSAIEPVFDGDSMTLPEINSSFYWVGGREHLWEAYYWDDLTEILKNTPMGEPVIVDGITYYGSDLSTAVASYDVGDAAKLYLIPTASWHLRAALVGSGETRNFQYKSHEWDEHGAEITEIYVGDGITALGNALFARLSNATRFVNASSALTSIGNLTFYRCFGLRTLSGLDRVTTIGQRAFLGCPSIVSIDLDEAVCKNAGDFAFHISSVEDGAPLAQWDGVGFGLCANRELKWGDTLTEVQNARYSATKVMQCTNPDMQTNYPGIDFCSGINGGAHTFVSVSDGGCVGLSLYHAYNTVHANDGLACASFMEFWLNVLRAESYTAPVTHCIKRGLINPILVYDSNTDNGYVKGVEERDGNIYFHLYNFSGGTDDHEILGAMLRNLGWKMSEKIRTYGAEAKRLIDRSLQQGIPVLATVNHMSTYEDAGHNEGDHEVCIIGCDAVTGKLTVVDSTGAAGSKGHIYTVAYEDMFYSHEEEEGQLRNSIILLDIGEEA